MQGDVRKGSWVWFEGPKGLERGIVTYVGLVVIEVQTPEGRYTIKGMDLRKDPNERR